jgi:hypothetical protein
MTTLEMPTETIAPVSAATAAEDVLDTLLLVARRADILARRQQTATRETDRRLWLRAEMEIFDAAALRRIAPSSGLA